MNLDLESKDLLIKYHQNAILVQELISAKVVLWEGQTFSKSDRFLNVQAGQVIQQRFPFV